MIWSLSVVYRFTVIPGVFLKWIALWWLWKFCGPMGTQVASHVANSPDPKRWRSRGGSPDAYAQRGLRSIVIWLDTCMVHVPSNSVISMFNVGKYVQILDSVSVDSCSNHSGCLVAEFKVLLIGEHGVGKTALLLRHLTGEFFQGGAAKSGLATWQRKWKGIVVTRWLWGVESSLWTTDYSFNYLTKPCHACWMETSSTS